MRRLATPLLAITSACLALATAEVVARFYYARTYDVAWTVRPSELRYAYYPELRPAMAPGAAGTPAVLLLGASVLNQTFGDVPPRLRSALESLWKTEVRVVNVSMLGHGTLDSYYKYRALAGRRFDLVVVYHGINELRANNVPPESWRDDYGHYAWYDEINFYFRHETWQRWPFVLPFFSKHLAIEIDRSVLRRRVYLSLLAPDASWLRFGASIKSAPVFRRNIERILDLAAARRQLVLLMTFAHHLPADYSLERFQRGEFGYGSWAGSTPSPVELWGTPEYVRAGLAEHDRVLRALHTEHPEALFVDQDARLGADPANFVDVCHLSPEGVDRFVAGIVDEIRRRDLRPAAREEDG